MEYSYLPISKKMEILLSVANYINFLHNTCNIAHQAIMDYNVMVNAETLEVCINDFR